MGAEHFVNIYLIWLMI